MIEKEFDEYLHKTALDLHDYAVHLYYDWIIIHSQRLSYRNEDRSLIKEIDAIFPLNKADNHYQLAKPHIDLEFKKEAQKFVRHTFLDDPLKEMALVFWHVSNPTREEFPLTNKNAFHFASTECYCLSILYDNFFEFKEIVDDPENFISNLDSLRQNVLSNADKLTGYWFSEDTHKQGARKGGRQPKIKQGIALAIQKALRGFQQENSTLSREDLWRYFKQNHDINDGQESMQLENYEVYYSDGRLFQESYSGGTVKMKSISKSIFLKYVSSVRKKLGQ